MLFHIFTYLLLFKFESSNGFIAFLAATLAGLLLLLGALGLSKCVNVSVSLTSSKFTGGRSL